MKAEPLKLEHFIRWLYGVTPGFVFGFCGAGLAVFSISFLLDYFSIILL